MKFIRMPCLPDQKMSILGHQVVSCLETESVSILRRGWEEESTEADEER